MTFMLLTASVWISTAVFAYIGPGLGAGAIAATLGLIGSFFLGIFTILFYPIKRLIKKFRKSSEAQGDNDDNA